MYQVFHVWNFQVRNSGLSDAPLDRNYRCNSRNYQNTLRKSKGHNNYLMLPLSFAEIIDYFSQALKSIQSSFYVQPGLPLPWMMGGKSWCFYLNSAPVEPRKRLYLTWVASIAFAIG